MQGGGGGYSFKIDFYILIQLIKRKNLNLFRKKTGWRLPSVPLPTLRNATICTL